MSDPIVIVDRVWKKFRRGERHDSLRDLVPALARGLWRGRRSELERDEFWAIEDVSFEVRAGEALGIVGPNGSGKSTTLKLLTRILKPNQGRIEARGRVGALIEVAAGFHPDLTGRENVYLQGAIMRMRQAEIARKFDDIVEFAGLQSFIDTPVKRYSSGMNARLGFSIAAHLDPQVLVIDEVLAVGDMAFQLRCLERMNDFKHRGVAIIFVSHNLQAVAELCDRAVYLERTVRASGPTPNVLERYIQASSRPETRATTGAIEITGAELLDDHGRPPHFVQPGAKLALRVTYVVHKPIGNLVFGFFVYRSTDRLPVYDATFTGEELGMSSLSSGDCFVVDFDFRAHLTRGQYHLGSHVFHYPTQQYTSHICPVGMFSVSESRTSIGVADLAVQAALVNGNPFSDQQSEIVPVSPSSLVG